MSTWSAARTPRAKLSPTLTSANFSRQLFFQHVMTRRPHSRRLCMLLFALFLAAPSQPLPEALQTVSLKIVQTHRSHGDDIYVVMSPQFDAHKPARVAVLAPRGNTL